MPALLLLDKDYVDGVISRYRGTALGLRVLALHGGLSGELQRAALAAALAKMAQGAPVGGAPVWNTQLYGIVHARLAACHADAPKLDEAWLSATEAKMAARQQELERDVAHSVSASIRDSQRVRQGEGCLGRGWGGARGRAGHGRARPPALLGCSCAPARCAWRTSTSSRTRAPTHPAPSPALLHPRPPPPLRAPFPAARLL